MRGITTALVFVGLVIVCAPAFASQQWMIGEDPEGFVPTVGAIVMIALGFGLNYPHSLLSLCAASLIALSKRGRNRWRVWIALGIISVIPSLMLYDDYGNVLDYLRLDNDFYYGVGLLAVYIVPLAVLIIYYAVKVRPRIFRKKDTA